MAHWLEALKERFPIDIDDMLREFGSEPIPGHLKRWWFALGGTPAYLFIIQAITGILLTFYYVPAPDQAYESVRFIREQLPFGWYIRSLHYWCSHLLIASIILHMMRVYFTGAYRKPREFTWVTGFALLVLMMVMGFTGYSLVYEQLSYWGATVAGNLTESVPMIGPIIAHFIRGGPEIGANTLTRFYIFHIAGIPTLIVLFLALHITLVRLHGVTPLTDEAGRPEDRQTFPFFPDHFLTELAIGLILMIILTVLACIFPAGLAEKANPLVTPEHIKPEWYFLFTFRWLKLTGLTFAVLSIGFFAFLAMVWPWIDGFWRKRHPKSEASTWIGVMAVLTLIGMTLWEVLSRGG